MRDPRDDAAWRGLRPGRWRNAALALLVVLGVWAVARRYGPGWGVRPGSILAGLVLATSSVVAMLPAGLMARLDGRIAAAPVHRVADRRGARSRVVVIIAAATLLLAQATVLSLSWSGASTAGISDQTIIALAAFLPLFARQSGRAGDAASQRCVQVATTRALVGTLAGVLAALLLAGDRRDALRPAVEMALIVGCLVWPVSLQIDERRAAG